MHIVDCHVHQSQLTDALAAAKWLETSGVQSCHLMSLDPTAQADGGREAVENLAEIARQLPGKIVPLAWIDPVHTQAPQIAEWALTEGGMKALKLIPTSWYPDDPRARKIYQIAQDHNAAIQFHSGILWLDGDNSKYCRPAGYEVMIEYPGVRFSLAHIGWPWTDECIAVVQKFKVMNRRKDRQAFQAMVDLTPGTPTVYRRDALMKCLACCGADYMMFGSDSGIPSSYLPEGKWRRDFDLLTELGCTSEDLEKVFRTNAERFIRGTQ